MFSRSRSVLVRAFARPLCVVLCSLCAIPVAEATVTLVQGSTGVTEGSHTISTEFQDAQNAGDLNVVAIGWTDSTTTITSVTDSSGNTYTLGAGPTQITATGTTAIYYAKNIASAAAGNTVTVHLSNSSVGFPEVMLAEYSGVDVSSPVDVAVGTSGNSTTASTGSFTTTNANDVILTWTYTQTSVIGVSSGFTLELISNDNLVQDRLTTSAGSYSASVPIDPSGWWIMDAVAFKAAAGGGDTQAPTVPASVTATAASSTQINLSWTASTDNVAVTGYEVQRCQGAACTSFVAVGAPTGASFNDTGLTPGTTYRYQVRARDAVPNWSATSSIVSGTTSADTTAPSVPSALTATVISGTQINLSWTASTDNVAVTGYRVERCQGSSCSSFAQVGTPTGTTFNDTGLTASTSYSYRVRAADAVPNLSGYSSTVSATTSAATSGTTAGSVTYQYDSFGRLKQVTVVPQ